MWYTKRRLRGRMTAKEEVIELIRHKFCDSCDGKGSDVCYACPVDEITAAIGDLPEDFNEKV
jgi:hypothetical protein